MTGVGNFTQGWRLERTPVSWVFSNDESPFIRVRLIHSDAEIVVCVRREIDTLVTLVTLRLVHEYVQAADLNGRHRILLAGLIAIVRRIAREHRALIRGDCLTNLIDCEILGSKRIFEKDFVTGYALQVGNQRVMR